MEIERKFIVNNIPPDLKISSKKQILQGYLAYAENGTEVRVRKLGNNSFLTIKGPGDLMRKEIEIPIDSDKFKSLWPLTLGKQIQKTRYNIRIENKIVEIDIYKGQLKGLIIAEIEFDSEEDCNKFNPLPWFEKEVTYNPDYKNKNLAVHQNVPIIYDL